jgi:hypothetical protein
MTADELVEDLFRLMRDGLVALADPFDVDDCPRFALTARGRVYAEDVTEAERLFRAQARITDVGDAGSLSARGVRDGHAR